MNPATPSPPTTEVAGEEEPPEDGAERWSLLAAARVSAARKPEGEKNDLSMKFGTLWGLWLWIGTNGDCPVNASKCVRGRIEPYIRQLCYK